jgi:hypothetical protein
VIAPHRVRQTPVSGRESSELSGRSAVALSGYYPGSAHAEPLHNSVDNIHYPLSFARISADNDAVAVALAAAELSG